MASPRYSPAQKRGWQGEPALFAARYKDEPKSRWERIVHFVARGVWVADTSTMRPLQRFGYKLLRIMSLALRGFVRDRCPFRAQALTFITTMSIVPLLAFVFSVAKGLGIYQQLETELIVPFLDDNVGVAIEGSSVGLRSSLDKLLAMVNQTDFAGLGIFGLAILLYTVIKLMSSIENSFNEIWGVEAPRSLPRKVADYLSVLVVVPVLLIVAAGATATIRNAGASNPVGEFLHLGPMLEVVFRFGSFFAAWFGFAFVYLFMPNTRVKLFSALMGGLLGSLMWSVAQVLYVKLQFGVANHSAIYASIAAIPIFLVWVNASWLAVLLGAELSFAHQNEPAFRQIARSREEDQAFRERVALRALARLARAFDAGDALPSVPDLAEEIGVPERSLERVLAALAEAGLVTRVESRGRTYTFTQSTDAVHVKTIIDALKGKRSSGHLDTHAPLDARLEGLLDAFEAEMRASEHNKSIRELGQA